LVNHGCFLILSSPIVSIVGSTIFISILVEWHWACWNDWEGLSSCTSWQSLRWVENSV